MVWRGMASAFLTVFSGWLAFGALAVTHYERPPCSGDEVQGEVQGQSGNVCAPRCRDTTFDCPGDMPVGSGAQPQCMLQDVDQNAYCGLLCAIDAQCPSGATCRQVVDPGSGQQTGQTPQIGLCVYPVSFTDWAATASASQRKKLVIGWPQKATGSEQGFRIAKAYAALQALKKKYGVEDGDADVLTVKEFLSSLSVNSASSGSSAGQVATGASVSGASGSGDAARRDGLPSLGGFSHDYNYLMKNLRDGVPGMEREIHDTVWNIEHLENYGMATSMLRGILELAAIYLIVGCGYKYYATGAVGMDMIPHISFWMEYPALMMDGVQYAKNAFGAGDGFASGASGGGASRAGFEPIRSSSERDSFASFEPSKA